MIVKLEEIIRVWFSTGCLRVYGPIVLDQDKGTEGTAWYVGAI